MTMYDAYEHYYGSRSYDVRYPRPNRFTYGRLLHLPASSTLIDIGAGNGRYAIPLVEAGYQVVAVERSEMARAQLAERAWRAEIGEDRLRIASDLSEVPPSLIEQASAVLLLFGVLGHMDRWEREKLLTDLAAQTGPSTRLLGSVPNRYRRFRREQRVAAIDDGAIPPRFWYERDLDGSLQRFQYSAFSPRDLRAELARSGWSVQRTWAETVMTEKIVTSNGALGLLDKGLVATLPSHFGYCVYFEAQMEPARLPGRASESLPSTVEP